MNFENSTLVASVLFGFFLGVRIKTPIQRLSLRQKLVIIFNTNNVRRLKNSELILYSTKASILAYQTSKTQTPLSHYIWTIFGQPKIVLQNNTSDSLDTFAHLASKSMICSAVIADRRNGVRVLAIGPGPKSAIDEICGHLKLL